MKLTQEQVKGRIRSIANRNNADARLLMRIYMMERFLERLSVSRYYNNFIVKGGILVTAMVGVAHRSTMDIDASVKKISLSKEEVMKIVDEIKDIDIDDGVTFEIKEASTIMDEMEYSGIRITMSAFMGNMETPLKLDISTGDVITPHAVEFKYNLMLEDRSISLWTYNLETILAEKIQTVLSRGILNTRMRDYYDICTLYDLYEKIIDIPVLKQAFEATCRKRETEHLLEQAKEIFEKVASNDEILNMWMMYQRKYPYAKQITFEKIVCNIGKLLDILSECSLG